MVATKLNRRQFLILSGGSAAAVLLSQCDSSRSQENRASSSSSSSSQAIYSSSNGLLEVDLEARLSSVSLGSQTAQLLTYNGQIPAPRLEAQPGDKVRIRFTNNLDEPTNLHFHGLHIPFTGNADNIFLNIESGETFTYEFDIPTNHKAGTFWYHPHRHGLVAKQLFGGLAGLFAIRGELDEIPEIQAAQEEFLVLQDFAVDESGNRLDEAQLALMTGREGDIITINGQTQPQLTIPQNGWVRWRIVNASPSRFYRLSLEGHSFHIIATDGGAVAKPISQSEVLLTPGERVEVLIQGTAEAKDYRLVNLPYNRGRMGMMGGGGMMGGNPSNEAPTTLATVRYQDAVATEAKALPTQLIDVPELPEPNQVRQFQLNHGMSPGMGMVFLINGKPFEGDRVDTQVRLNTVEDWEIINTGMMDHPFHVHGNAFQVISRNNIPERDRAWKDTVLVKTGETVRIRIPFRDHTGKTVYHCHVLDHEDLGMMGNLMIEA
ncbi:MAG: multicopper oxidase family protein [Jaaginema sp. PMC 1080.18]|nr:multicopper oxidase family protein [Jaaginema sp. PMC 1080.18]MEC4864572.1 multicopper oxidase family protein [Jaaginema sp. PMC 1078.18]